MRPDYLCELTPTGSNNNDMPEGRIFRMLGETFIATIGLVLGYVIGLIAAVLLGLIEFSC